LRSSEHAESGKIRLIMRRDKTLKVCANHYVTADMTLAPNVGSDRSWVWNVHADVSDGEPQAETLAVRFANSENANNFKAEFEKAQKYNVGLTGLLTGTDNAPQPHTVLSNLKAARAASDAAPHADAQLTAYDESMISSAAASAPAVRTDVSDDANVEATADQ